MLEFSINPPISTPIPEPIDTPITGCPYTTPNALPIPIPINDEDLKDIFVIQLEIKTPIRQIKTGYGVSKKDAEQNMDYFVNLGEQIGFKVIKKEQQDQVFKIIFRK